MHAIVYRRSTKAEVESIFAVRTAVRENILTMAQLAERGITPATYAESLRTGELVSFSATRNGRVLGFSGVRPAAGEVFALFVLPEAEGNGIGSRLLAMAEEHLSAGNYATMSLETERGSRAHRFYLRRGWRESERPAASATDLVLIKASEVETERVETR